MGRIMGAQSRFTPPPTPPLERPGATLGALIHARGSLRGRPPAARPGPRHTCAGSHGTRCPEPSPPRPIVSDPAGILQAGCWPTLIPARVAYRCRANTSASCSSPPGPARRDGFLVAELQLVAAGPASRGFGQVRAGDGHPHTDLRRHLQVASCPLPHPVRLPGAAAPLGRASTSPGPFIHREVVQRRRARSTSGWRPGIGPDQLHAAGRGGPACTFPRRHNWRSVGRHLLGEQSRTPRADRASARPSPPSGLTGRLGHASWRSTARRSPGAHASRRFCTW